MAEVTESHSGKKTIPSAAWGSQCALSGLGADLFSLVISSSPRLAQPVMGLSVTSTRCIPSLLGPVFCLIVASYA